MGYHFTATPKRPTTDQYEQQTKYPKSQNSDQEMADRNYSWRSMGGAEHLPVKHPTGLDRLVKDLKIPTFFSRTFSARRCDKNDLKRSWQSSCDRLTRLGHRASKQTNYR
jgi:hypothetical protein